MVYKCGICGLPKRGHECSGPPPPPPPPEMTVPKPSVLEFTFDDFERLPSDVGRSVSNHHAFSRFIGNRFVFPEASVQEKRWGVAIFPGGRSREDQGFVRVHLLNRGNQDVTAAVSFVVRQFCSQHKYKPNAGGTYSTMELTLEPQVYRANDVVGAGGIVIERSVVLDESSNILARGALVIDVVIQVCERVAGGRLHVPPNQSRGLSFLQLSESIDDADVAFQVGDELIYAHKHVLKENAPHLFDLCEQADKGDPIEIKNTSPEVFRMLCEYIYGGDIPKREPMECDLPHEEPILKMGVELIDAADQYCVVGLKMLVEAYLVAYRRVNRANVVEMLLMADSKNCALLKEYAFAYAIRRTKDVYRDLYPTLMESGRLFTEHIMSMPDNNTGPSVNEMRKELHQKGLDVDGSKAMLSSRLEDSYSSKKRAREE